MAWTQIAETIVGAPGAAVVTFLAIPQTYRVLSLIGNLRTNRAAESDQLVWRANNDGAANYDKVLIYTSIAAGGDGHWGARATTGEAAWTEAALSRANCFGPIIAFWYDYASASAEKTLLTVVSSIAGNRSADTDVFVGKWANWWRNTAAITRLDFLPSIGPNFVQGSRFTLYGIA